MGWFDVFRRGRTEHAVPLAETVERPEAGLPIRDALTQVAAVFGGVDETQRRELAGLVQEGILDMTGLYDPDANLTAAQGGSLYYRRLSQSMRDLNPLTQERAQQIAFWLQESNPLAKGILELSRAFIIGDGLRYSVQRGADEQTGEADAIEQVAEQFWDDPFNNCDLGLYQDVYELSWSGELCYPVAVNPRNGHVRLGFLDPGLIRDVLQDPKTGRPEAVVLKTASSDTSQRYRVVQPDDDPASEWYGRLRSVETDDQGTVLTTWEDRAADGQVTAHGTYLGACLLYQINKPKKAHRGRGDLQTALDWLDAYDQLLFNGLDRSLLLKSFVWDVTLTGASEKQIDDYLKKFGGTGPKPGSVRAHNDSIEWAAVTPDLKIQDDQTLADLVLSLLATAVGLPKTWLNGTLDVNRASATELGEPAIARLSARQRYVRYVARELLTFALDQAEMHGTLTRRDNEVMHRAPPWPIDIHTPDLRQRDTVQSAQAFAQVVQGVAAALADDVLDQEAAQELVVTLAKPLGVEIDLKTMRERIEMARAERATQPYRPTLVPLPAVAAGQADPSGEQAAAAETPPLGA